MVKSGVVQNVHHRMYSPSFRILRTVHEGADAGMHHGSGAHGAWLDGDEKIAASQAMISDGCSGLPQGHDLGMRRRIRIGEVAIESAANDFSFMDDDRADWYLAKF